MPRQGNERPDHVGTISLALFPTLLAALPMAFALSSRGPSGIEWWHWALLVVGVGLGAMVVWVSERDPWRRFVPPPGIAYVHDDPTLPDVWGRDAPNDVRGNQFRHVLRGQIEGRQFVAFQAVGDGAVTGVLLVRLGRTLPRLKAESNDERVQPYEIRRDGRAAPAGYVDAVAQALAGAGVLNDGPHEWRVRGRHLITNITVLTPELALADIGESGTHLARIADVLDRMALPGGPGGASE